MATGGIVLTKENKNYTRATFLVVDLGTEAVREVFDKIPIFEPKVLSKNLELNRVSREMKAVPPFLKDILFPSKDESRVLKSSEFDLTMMVSLMDKLYIPPPAEVLIWDATKDIIKIIKESRNKLAHVAASVSDQCFNDIWRDTSNAILSLVDAAFKPRYQQKMKHLLQMTIDDGVFNTALAVMERIRVEIRQLQATQRRHGSQITGLQATQSRHGSQIIALQDTQSRHCSQITGLQDTQSRHGSKTTELQDTQSRHGSQISELQDTQSRQGSQLSGLQDTESQHVSQITGLQATQSQHGSQITELQTDVEKLRVKGAVYRGSPETSADIGELIQKVLKDKYRDEMACINCNPLEPDATQPIDELFVNLSLVEEDVNYKAGKEKRMKPLQHYRDIFQDQSEKGGKKEILRILIQGKPGMGKTTLTNRMAVDWTERKELSERFENVFVLTLRKVKPDQTLVDVIAEQLLPHKSSLVQHLETYIEENSAKCLFIFDGLDEMTQNTSQEIDEMIKRNYLKYTCLVITSRPTQAQHLTTKSKVDQHVRIEGFTKENVKSFIENFFGEIIVNKGIIFIGPIEASDPDESVNEDSDSDGRVNEEYVYEYEDSDSDGSVIDISARYWYHVINLDDNTSTALFKEIKTKGLLDIAQIPLILNILCLLYIQDETNRSLPENMSKIYDKLQQLLCKRQKDEESENETDLEEILHKLGKMAFEGLLKENNQLFFEKKKILEEVGEDALKVGLICMEKAKYGFESNTQVYFLHKSFQEKIASFYLGKETDKDNDEPWEKLKIKMKTIQDIGEQDLLLQFCAGASPRLAEQILYFLDEKVNEIDAKLKAVLQLMDKLSQNKDLSKRELETVCNHEFKIWDVQHILELEAKYLSNVENPTEIRSHVVNQVFSKTEKVKKARERNILKPKKCIVTISNDQDLKDFVKITTSVSWIKLEGANLWTRYSLTERTVCLLREMCDRNEHQVSVCIGRCEADCTTLLKVIHLLKSNTKIKYKIIPFGTVKLNNGQYEKAWWEKVFQILSGIRYLIALNLCNCKIPFTVLATIGQIINENADTLLQLDIEDNREIGGKFDVLSKNIKNQLSLTVLKLSKSLDPPDTDAVRNLLKKCKHIKVLDVHGCRCEISEDILKFKNIKEIDIRGTVDKDTGKGLDVGRVLANLDKLEMLEVIDTQSCQIDDAQIQNIPFNKPSKIRKINFILNRIGHQGLQYLCEHHTMLQELEEIRLDKNKIGDEGGKVLMEHLQHFRNMRHISVYQTGMSEEINEQIKEKGNEYSIDFFTDLDVF